MGAKLALPQLARSWQLLLKALSEVQTAPDPAAAAEMAMIRIGFASELPPTEQIIRSLGSSATAVPARSPAGGGTASPPPPPAPSLRAASTSGDTVASAASPAPRPRPEAPPAPEGQVTLSSFEDVVALVREKREMRLLYALENQVHLVGFDRERIEIRVTPTAPPSLPGEISDRLSKWTGQRWIVSVSSAEGAPTIADQKIAIERARREAAEQDPLLKAAMAVFPGARLVAVRDKDEYAAPIEGGDDA
jgi:DNA polymerase-3 subunit gamma/tau